MWIVVIGFMVWSAMLLTRKRKRGYKEDSLISFEGGKIGLYRKRLSEIYYE